MSEIVLRLIDTLQSAPARNVKVGLEVSTPEGEWRDAARGVTNESGRVALDRPAAGPTGGVAGSYRLRCGIGVHFARTGAATRFPEICVHLADDGAGPAPRLRIEFGPDAYTVSREDDRTD